MKTNKLFIMIVGLIILAGCSESNKRQASIYPDSLIVVPGAENIQYTKSEEGLYLNGEIGGGKIIDGEYIHEKKGYKISLPPKEWIPGAGSIPDICLSRDGGYMLVAVFDVEDSYPFEDANKRWKDIMIECRDWTDVKTLYEKDLTMAGHDAKAVIFEYTQYNIRYVTMAYQIWRPEGKHKYYRIRLNCYKEKFEEYKGDFQTFADSFSFL